MKRILFILLLNVIAINSFSQAYIDNHNYGNQADRLRAIQVLNIPRFATRASLSVNTYLTPSSGAIAYVVEDSSFNLWTGYTWIPWNMGGGGGSQNLASVLGVGNSAGAHDINLNNNSIQNGTTYNSGSSDYKDSRIKYSNHTQLYFDGSNQYMGDVDAVVSGTKVGVNYTNKSITATADSLGITKASSGSSYYIKPNPEAGTGSLGVYMPKRSHVNDTIAVTSQIPTSFPPSGTAGGDLTGSNYPNPVVAAGVITEDKTALSVKPSVAVVATTNLSLTGEQTIDGQLTSGSTVLLTGQTSGAENGFWVTSSGAWSRPTWFSNGSNTQAPRFLTTFVRLGNTYQGSTWRMTTAPTVIIGTTPTVWLQTPLKLNSNTVAGGLPTANGGVPTGGSSGQVLAKNSGTDNDLVWSTPSGGGGSTHMDSLRLGSNYATVGTFLDQYWNGGSLPSDWTKGGSFTSTYSSSGVTVSGGTGVYTNYLQWDYVNYDRIVLDVTFVVQSKASTDSGIAITFAQIPSSIYDSHVTFKVDLTNGVDSGKIFFGGVAISTNSSFAIGDTGRFKVVRDMTTLYASLTNFRTKVVTPGRQQLSMVGIGSGGKLRIVPLGGTQKIIHVGGVSNSNYSPKMVFLTTSVGMSGSTSFPNTWVGIVARGNAKRIGFYGAPGIMSSDMIAGFVPLMKNVIHTGSKQTIFLAIEENDVGNHMPASYSDTANFRARARAIRDTLYAHGTDANFIWVSAAPRRFANPNAGYDTVIQSVAASYNDQYVNISTLTTNTGYSGGYAREGLVALDGIHPSDSSASLIAQQVIAKIPYTTYADYYADTLGYSYFNLGNMPRAQLDAMPLMLNNDGSVGVAASKIDGEMRYAFLPNTANSSGQGYKAPANTALYTDMFVGTDGIYQSGNPIGFVATFNTTTSDQSTALPNRAGSNIIISNSGNTSGAKNFETSAFTATKTIVINTGGPTPHLSTNAGTRNIFIGVNAGFGSNSITSAAVDVIDINTGTNLGTLTSGNKIINISNSEGVTTGNNWGRIGWGDAGAWTNSNNSFLIGSNTNGDAATNEFVLNLGGSIANTFRFGGASSYNTPVTFAVPTNNNTNASGFAWTFKSSAGNGTGQGGIYDFQTTTTSSHAAWVSRFKITQDSVEFKTTMKVSAAEKHVVVFKSANYTLSATTDYTVICTSNSFTVTLPTAVGNVGLQYVIRNSGAGIITLATTSSQTIDGTTPGTLAASVGLIHLVSDGVNWITN